MLNTPERNENKGCGVIFYPIWALIERIRVLNLQNKLNKDCERQRRQETSEREDFWKTFKTDHHNSDF